MAVQFVIGRAGTGKTHHCLEAITGACREDPVGPPVIYLVPEQASYQAEKALLTHGPLQGITRAQVLSFTRLADYIFAHSAAPQTPRMTKAHRRVLVMLLVSRARREDPDGLAGAQGIEDALMDFLAETRQQAVDPQELRHTAETLRQGKGEATPLARQLLAAKLDRLCALVESFQEFVHDRFQDPQDTLVQLAEAIATNDHLRGTRIYVDGFTGFTPVEEKLLAALARRASEFHLTLPADPDRCLRIQRGEHLRRHPVFQATEETFRDLLRLFDRNDVTVSGLVPLREVHRFHPPALKATERHFFSTPNTEQTPADGITFHESGAAAAEAREAAEVAAQWLREDGWRPSDIAILTRDLDRHADPLAQALTTLKIPFFIDRAQPLSTHPLVTGLVALCRASLSKGMEFSRNILDFGKSGLHTLPHREIDHLEFHVLQYPRYPGDWFDEAPWKAPPPRSAMQDERTGRQGDLDGSLDATRRALVDEVRQFREMLDDGGAHGGRLKSFIRAAAASLERLAAARRLDEADQRIYSRIGEFLSIALETAGDEEVTWDLAVELLQRLLGDLTLPRIPPMSGQLIVGQADRSRQPPVRGAIVLGLSEGIFPRILTNHSLVNDGERDLLEDVGLRLRPSGRRQFEREALHAYRAITSPSERLALFRPCEDGQGGSLAESSFWENLRSIHGDAPVLRLPPPDDPSRAWRRRELAGAALRTIDHSHISPMADASPGAGLLDELGTTGEEEAVIRAAKWRNQPTLDPGLVRAALRDPVRLSASQMEAFAKCPFRHFVNYLLRPAEPLLPRFERHDAGNFFHAVLREFTALLRGRGLLGSQIPPEQLQALVDEASAEPTRRLERTGLLQGAPGVYLQRRLRDILLDMARWLVESFQTIALHPVLEETGFGFSGESLPPLEIKLEDPPATIQIRGQIDRIDILEADGEEAHAVVVDYKLKQRTFQFHHWEHREALQLPVYLLALEGREINGRRVVPRGAFYLEIMPKTRDENTFEDRLYDGLVSRSMVETLFPGVNYRKIPLMKNASADPERGPTSYGPVVTDGEFRVIMTRTRAMIRELAAGILKGDADVKPSRFGTQTACSICSAGPICGIDYRINRARPCLKRSQQAILAELRTEGGDDS